MLRCLKSRGLLYEKRAAIPKLEKGAERAVPKLFLARCLLFQKNMPWAELMLTEMEM